MMPLTWCRMHQFIKRNIIHFMSWLCKVSHIITIYNNQSYWCFSIHFCTPLLPDASPNPNRKFIMMIFYRIHPFAILFIHIFMNYKQLTSPSCLVMNDHSVRHTAYQLIYIHFLGYNIYIYTTFFYFIIPFLLHHNFSF